MYQTFSTHPSINNFQRLKNQPVPAHLLIAHAWFDVCFHILFAHVTDTLLYSKLVYVY